MSVVFFMNLCLQRHVTGTEHRSPVRRPWPSLDLRDWTEQLPTPHHMLYTRKTVHYKYTIFHVLMAALAQKLGPFPPINDGDPHASFTSDSTRPATIGEK